MSGVYNLSCETCKNIYIENTFRNFKSGISGQNDNKNDSNYSKHIIKKSLDTV